MSGGRKGTVGGAVTHGCSKGKRSREYRAWISMRQRCRQHAHYIKHGVSVCADWDSSFESFLLDVGPAPSEGHTLDRWPNADGNYEPGNVRWATMLEQRHNRRAGSRVGRPWLGKRRPSHSGGGNPGAKLTSEQVAAVRTMKASGARTIDLARRYGVSTTSIKNIVSRRTWGGA